MTFLGLLKRYYSQIFLAFTCIVFANLAALAFPWVLKILLDSLIAQKNNIPYSSLFAFLFMSITLKSTFEYQGSWLGLRISEKIIADLREMIYQRLLAAPAATLESYPLGELISRFMLDTESIKRFLCGGILDFFYSALSAFLVVMVLFFMDYKLACAALCMIGLFLLAYGKLTGKIKLDHDDLAQSFSRMSGQIGEVFRGIRTVQVFNRAPYELDKFKNTQTECLKKASRVYRADAFFLASTQFFSSAGILALLVYGTNLVLKGSMSVGTLAAFYSYIGLLFIPLLKMTAAGSSYREAKSSWNRIRNLLSFHDSVENQSPGAARKIEARHIHFKNVFFSYSGSLSVLQNFDLKIRFGEWVALTGNNGVGKTTVACLLARLMRPQSGKILLDEHDIQNMDLEIYRSRICVIFQNDYLFSGTIFENIRYGKLDASDKEVMDAAKICGVDSILSFFPEGYESRTGEAGIRLSSGQRQRICLARAILRDPDFLVLDEAMCHVDEGAISKAVENLRWIRRNKSTLLISHRVSTLSHADRVYRLSHGRVSEIDKEIFLKDGTQCHVV